MRVRCSLQLAGGNDHSEEKQNDHTPSKQVRKYRTATALHDYEPTDTDELGVQNDLSFKAGDDITLLSCDEHEQWWFGDVNGRQGLFPKDYVRLNDNEQLQDDGTLLMDKAVALYDYVAQDASDLSFRAGDELVLHAADPGQDW